MVEPLSSAHMKCCHAFQSLIRTIDQPARNTQDQITPADIHNEFDKYNIWAGNVGAAHSGKQYEISLDYRLRQALFLREHTSTLLTTLAGRVSTVNSIICHGLESHGEQKEDSDSESSMHCDLGEDWEEEGRESDDSPWEISSDSSNGDDLSSKHQPTYQESNEPRSGLDICQNPLSNTSRLVESIRFIINCLYRLPIRKAAPLDRLEHRVFADSTVYQHFDVLYVKDKFPHLEHQVATRLGKMITRRRQILSYREAHRQSLDGRSRHSQIAHSPQSQLTSSVSEEGLKNIVEDHSSTATSDRLAPSQAASSHFTLRSKATTVRPVELTPFAPQERMDMLTAPSLAETNSTAASSYAGTNLRVDVPSRPKGDHGEELEQFECPYCWLTKDIPNDRRWKKHVFEDLQPYVCTYGDCDLYDQFFESRDAWFHHEMQHHRTKWFCNIDGHPEYDSEKDFLLHMQMSHNRKFDETQFSIIKGIFRRPTKNFAGTCNLCHRDSKNLKSHLCQHLQQIAMFALPRTNNTTDSGQAERHSRSSRYKGRRLSDRESSRSSSSSYAGVLLNQQSALNSPTSDKCELELDHDTGDNIPDTEEDQGWDSVTDKFSKARERTFRRLRIMIVEMNAEWREKIAASVERLQVELMAMEGHYDSAAGAVCNHASPDVVMIGEVFGTNALARSIHQIRDVTDVPVLAMRQSASDLNTLSNLSNWMELLDPSQNDIEEALGTLCRWAPPPPHWRPATVVPVADYSLSTDISLLTLGRRDSGSGRRRERHQVEAEAPPEAVANMAEVQQALSDARTLTRGIANVLSSSSLHREDKSSIQNLYHQAIKLEHFELPSSRIVGLVGDSGVGKSSLINSLLDKRNLARASSAGAACTCAVTEYHFHERDDFIVHVDYFPMDELKQQFEELLRAYRDFQLLLDHRRDIDKDDVTDKEPQLQEKAKLAIQTFSTCFGERLQKVPGVLSSTPFKLAVATMVEWASQLLPQRAERNIASTIEDCASWLQTYSSQSDLSSVSGNSQAPWPFVKKVRVYLKAYILSKGLIIADLPGLRDLNSARQVITERYVRQCHQILVVARIDRAITDESIKHICELARRVNLSKVDFVCTFSEDVKTEEALDDWPKERAKIDALQREIAVNVDKMDSLSEEIDHYGHNIANLTREEERKFSQLQWDYRMAEKSKENGDLHLKRFIVTLRNDKVSHGLREEYHDYLIATSLSIFCVSNAMYWENREKSADIALPHLRFSGILELRRYCISIVAESRLQATQTFIQEAIPTLIGSVQLWVEAGSGDASAESKQRVLDAVSTIQHELDKSMSPVSQLDHISRTLETEFDTQIYMRMRQNRPAWSAVARQASSSWEGWHYTSYKAFCSKYGQHATSSIGSRCWNDEAIQGMTMDLSIFWDRFAKDLDTEIERFNTAAIHVYARVLETATSLAANNSRAIKDVGSAMQTLASNLLLRESLTRYSIEQVMDTFKSRLSSLRVDTLSCVRTSFIGRLMEETYHAANMEYGSGSDQRRKLLVTSRFSSPALFEAHQHACRERFRELARELQEKVIEVVAEQGKLIEVDLHLLRDVSATLETGSDVGFKKRVTQEIRSVTLEVARLGRVVSRV